MKMMFTAFVLLCGFCIYPHITSSQEAVKTTVAGGATEMNEAVALATAYVTTKSMWTGEYRLIATKNLFWKGMHVWLITFKSTDTIPKDINKMDDIGLGGELLVTVDLKEKKCILGYGE